MVAIDLAIKKARQVTGDIGRQWADSMIVHYNSVGNLMIAIAEGIMTGKVVLHAPKKATKGKLRTNPR